MTTLLSTTYFGPIQWYQKLCQSDHVLIEQCETFQKQTYRNRCVIATANGRQALTVPIDHSPSAIALSAAQDMTSANTVHRSPFTVQSIKDLRISDHGNWRHLHWNALVSAYGESPFFDYYQDDLRPFFTERRWTFLFDFNEEIRLKICELLDLHPSVTYTDHYVQSSELNLQVSKDFRDAITPKRPVVDADFTPRPYYQVNGRRHGFLPNLSILDLLFNMGSEGIFWLIASTSFFSSPPGPQSHCSGPVVL